MMPRIYHTAHSLPTLIDAATYSDPHAMYEVMNMGLTLEWELHLVHRYEPFYARHHIYDVWIPGPDALVMQVSSDDLARAKRQVEGMARRDGWCPRQISITDEEIHNMAITGATTTQIIWKAWSGTAGDYTDSGTASSTGNWVAWNDELYRAVDTDSSGTHIAYKAIRETDEIRQLREARERQTALLLEQKRKDAEKAKEKAEELLISVLTEEEVKEYKTLGTITIPVGEFSYRVTNGWAKNIYKLDKDGKKVKTLCVHPSKQCPTEDNMLAQVLFLKHQPEALFEVANEWSI